TGGECGLAVVFRGGVVVDFFCFGRGGDFGPRCSRESSPGFFFRSHSDALQFTTQCRRTICCGWSSSVSRYPIFGRPPEKNPASSKEDTQGKRGPGSETAVNQTQDPSTTASPALTPSSATLRSTRPQRAGPSSAQKTGGQTQRIPILG